jgi:serine/threonine protein kinase
MSSPSDLDWVLVRALFDAALALPPEQREAHVRASGTAPAVQAEVLSLLAHSTGGGHYDPDFLAEPASGPSMTATAAAGQPGQRLGAWTLVAPLGSGGMGEVWRARRADGAYEGVAAVKLLKRGMDSAAVLQRFAQERQALARLDHAHIARLFDAGLSAQGLPYFVMELVEGLPIDQACAGLPLEQRLALFLQLADAVAHAHRHLLVHRDLKPGNVLVNRDGQVKLLDFGIAKALDPLEDPGAPEQTQAGQRPFTPSHASPEQIRGEPVSTATDVYSLGVLLYQLLTGQRPYGRSATSAAEIARAVLQEPATRPSSLRPSRPDDPWWLATRQRLKGDLDNILLKTLEKEASERYASVDALTADVRAYLAGWPVSAHPPSAGYRAAKFISRHRVGSALGTLALLAVLGGTATALWQARIAREQSALAERRFNEVHQFARTMLIDVDTALRDGPTAGREKLVQTSLAYLDKLLAERLTDQALLRDVAEAFERIGDIQGNTMQSNLGRPEDAQQSYIKALASREALARLAPDDLKNIAGLKTAHERLGDNARARENLAQAAQHYEQALQHAQALARAQPGALLPDLKRIEADRYLASVYYWPYHASLGQYSTARARVEALDREMDTLLLKHPERDEVLEAYGGLLNQLGDFQRIAGEHALVLITQRKSLQLAERLLARAPTNPRWKRWMYLAEGRLADALIETGEVEAGITLWQASIARREEVALEDPSNERAQRNLANGYGPLAEQLDALGRHQAALVWYEREHALLKRLRAQHPQVKALIARLDESGRDHALQLALLGRHAQAGTELQAVLKRRSSKTRVDDAEDARFALVTARVLFAAGAPAPEASEAKLRWEQALQGLALLRAAAAKEPFNTLLARDAALAALRLAALKHAQDPSASCPLRQAGFQELRRLDAASQLPYAMRRHLGAPSPACPGS